MVEAMDRIDNVEQRLMQQLSSTNLHPTFEVLAQHINNKTLLKSKRG
jgi:hypothetical protein